MKNIRTIVIVALLLLAGYFVWQYFFPPPKKAIQQQLTKLASAISAHPEGNFAKVANVERIVGFFHPEVTVNLDRFGPEVESLQGASEIQRVAFAARQSLPNLLVRFENLKIEVDPAETHATVYCSLVVEFGQRREPIVQDVKIGMEKVNRSWLIRSATPGQQLIVQ